MHPKPLDETDMFVLFQEYEDVFLFEKDSNSVIWRTSMYGEATCGLIGLSNEWVIVGGKELILWKNNSFKIINDAELQCIHDVRYIEDSKINILTDPWSDHSAIWQFDVIKEEKLKIKDFPFYKSGAYTEEVLW